MNPEWLPKVQEQIPKLQTLEDFSPKTEKNNTIKQTLEDKFWWNTDAINKLYNIFDKLRDFWEDNISKYIKEDIPRRWINTFLEQENIEENITSQMRSFFKENWIIINISTIEQLTEDTSKLTEDTSKLTEKKENSGEYKEIAKALAETRANFAKIPEEDKLADISDIKQDSQERKNAQEIVKKINEIKPEQEISVQEFLSMQKTYQEYKETWKHSDFTKSFENLNNLVWSKRSFTPEKISDLSGKPENAINATNALIQSSNNKVKIDNYISSINAPSKNIPESPKERDNFLKDNFEKYQNFLTDLKTRDTYKENFDSNWKLKQWKTRENIDQNFKDQIINRIWQIESNTQEIFQQRVFGSSISWLASFFDFSEKEIKDDLKIWSWLDINWNELTLWWVVENNFINIRYNLWKLENNLSIEDYLFQTKDKNVLNFWKWNFEKLWISLPSITRLQNDATKILDNNQDSILKSSKDINEYKQNLEVKIHEWLMRNFQKNKNIVRTFIKESVQKNLAAQETLSDFKSIISPENKNIYWNNFNKQEKPELFNLVKILDDSLENYTISESKEFRENIGTLTKFIQESTEKQWEQNIIGKFFRKLFKKQENKSTIETEEKNTKNLLDTIEKLSIQKEWKKIIDINLLKKTVLETQKSEPNLDKIPEPLSESITNPNPGKLLEQEWLRQDRPPTA